MHGQTHVGEHVLHFGAIVEAESTDEFVTQAAPAKNFFEGARLEISAVFDGTRLVRIVIENAVEFAGDKFRFGLGVPRFEIFQVSPGTLLRAQRLAQPLRIVGNDRAGGVQNVLSGAVIALQLNDSGGGKIAGKTQEDGNVGAAPAVDGLILIADDTNVLLWSG